MCFGLRRPWSTALGFRDDERRAAIAADDGDCAPCGISSVPARRISSCFHARIGREIGFCLLTMPIGRNSNPRTPASRLNRLAAESYPLRI